MLRIKNLHHEINGKVLYRDLNLLLGNQEKIALIGRNGCGKTTLFKIIMGEVDPDKGELFMEGESVGYLPQILSLNSDEMVGEFIEHLIPESWEQYRAHIILDRLKFGFIDEYQLVGTLSEGQKMKLKLMEILLDEPTILLLDEPTNHLDIVGRKHFANFIKSFDGIVIMISHDRAFLNETIDRVIEIENATAQVYIGDYDDYKIGKAAWIEQNSNEVRLHQKKMAQLDKLLANVRKIKDGKKRGAAVGAVKKRIEREVKDNEVVKYMEKNISKLSLEGEVHQHKLIVGVENLCKSFGENKVLENVNLEIRGRDRVWLYGANGTGKSTLIKILMKELKEDSGTIRWGTNIRTGYFAQIQDTSINDYRLMEYFMKITETPFESAFGPLERFLFRKEDFGKKIGQMSPGERARLLFAIFTFNTYEFLILDEPTNHLDIPTKELIEKALRDYKGAVLLVSHDKYFVEQVGVNTILKFGEE